MPETDIAPQSEREQDLRKLVLLAQSTDRFVLAFALYDTPVDRNRSADDFQREFPSPVHVFVLAPTSTNPLAFLERMPVQERACVFFYDVEEAFPEFLGWVNLHREEFGRTRHMVVFWIREPGLREIAKKAPDFWAWRSGVFDLRPESDARSLLPDLPLLFGQGSGNLDALKERLPLLQRLAADQRLPPVESIERKLALANSLRLLGRFPESKAELLSALARVPDDTSRFHVLSDLQKVLRFNGEFERAAEMALEIDDVHQRLSPGANFRFSALNTPDAAANALKEMLNEARVSGLIDHEVSTAFHSALEARNDRQRWREHFAELISLYRRKFPNSEYGGLLLALGEEYLLDKNAASALSCFLEARPSLERTGPPDALARLYSFLAVLTASRQEKLELFKKAKAIYSELGFAIHSQKLDSLISAWMVP